jgi:transposase
LGIHPEDTMVTTIGVDTHKRLIVAVALDAAGQVIGEWSGDNTPDGWKRVQTWAVALGPDRVWGIEGSGQYGRGLAQQVVAASETAYEINPRWTAAARQRARTPGKSDRRDAIAIAQVVRQEGPTLPQLQPEDATVVVALLTSEREDAVRTATRLRNQLYQHLHLLDPTDQPRLTDPATVATLRAYAVADQAPALTQTHAAAVRRLARQLSLVLEQIDELTAAIEAEARAHWVPLIELAGVGALTAGMLAGYLGPGDRFARDTQLAAYAGVAPLETSSAGAVRHRLNRQGQRQLNAVIHRIALTQARCSPPAKAYLARRQQAGKTWREAIRALKRFIARAIFRRWRRCLAKQNRADATTS